MCGIAGCVQFSKDARVEASILRRMCDVMVHRGPDDEGVFAEGPVGLGARRLSIIDLATGHQPISNEDGTVWIVFNGEIYNHAELRTKLQACGHRFASLSDTEAIVHAYEEYGRDCVRYLRGMFAFAVWDARTRQVFIARDRLGIKPLYYRWTPESLLFGSEIKVILAHPDVRPRLNRSVLPEYLAFGYLSGEDTFYEGIRKLKPGHTMLVDENGTVRTEAYWDLSVGNDDESRPARYYIHAYRDQLEQAVRTHLMSDVPVGVFLSGGLDSSAIAALMTRLSGERIETFSVGYAEASYSELPYARAVAKHLNSIHHEVLLTREEFFDALPKVIWHEDEPVAWPSSVALYFVSRLASTRVKVVLTGEGSDETLAGYARYAFTLKNAALDRAYRSIMPRLLRDGLRRSISQSSRLSASMRRKLSHTFLARNGESWQSFYFDNFFSAFGAHDQEELLADEVMPEVEASAAYRNVLGFWEHAEGGMLHKMLYTDIKTYLVELLMKQDNMSMAASVESRVPFLDHPLVEFALTIPAAFQLRGTSGKHTLKQGVVDLLPRDVIYRRKLGFPTPWSGWLSGVGLDYIESLLLEQRSIERGFFKPATVRRLFREHRVHYRDHYDRIWRLLNFELWCRVCLEGESCALPAEPREIQLASGAA